MKSLLALLSLALLALPLFAQSPRGGNVQRDIAGKIIGPVVIPAGSSLVVEAGATVTGITSGSGSTLRFGSGAPASDLGADGDVYTDITSGAQYKKVSGSWGTAQVTFVLTADSRLSNARTPTAHTHPVADLSDATAFTRGFLAAVDAAAGRAALGLGSLATQSGTFSGTSSGTNTGDQTTITGNAGTATTLQTARTIGGTSFNGSANVAAFPAPGPIGGTTPSTGAFTTITASSTIAATGAVTGSNLSGTNTGDQTPTSLGLVIGTNVQAQNAKLSAIAALANASGYLLNDGAGNFSYATPSGGGSGTVTSASVVPANGVSATVATATTTPAFTFTLGAITPTSVAATGTVTGSNLSGTNTGDQTTITGNAGTATTLQTARTIGGTSFNGSATVAAFPAPGPIGGTTPSTGAFTTITASSTIAATGAVTGANLSGTNTGDQTTITGNAGTATTLQTARTINGVSFNGSANITLSSLGGAGDSASTFGNLPAGTTSKSSLRLAHGVAPTAPVNGDVWSTTAGIYAFINGTTVGPFGAGGGTGDVTAAANFGTDGLMIVSDGTLKGIKAVSTLAALSITNLTFTNLTGTVGVANGGTGRTTGTTAYALVATGTTATGAQQTLANGATTEILVGGGAAALPVWTTATGSGSPVRATSPTLVTPVLGTPSSGTLTSCTGLPIAGLVASTSTALGVGSVELGHASDTTLSRSAAGVLAVEGVVVPTISSTSTLTNKRITARVTSLGSGATPTINTDACDCVNITGLAVDITSMTTNLTGTPAEFDQLEFRITGTGTRNITWGAKFLAGPTALPTATSTTKALHVWFEWDTVRAAWICMYSGSDA